MEKNKFAIRKEQILSYRDYDKVILIQHTLSNDDKKLLKSHNLTLSFVNIALWIIAIVLVFCVVFAVMNVQNVVDYLKHLELFVSSLVPTVQP